MVIYFLLSKKSTAKGGIIIKTPCPAGQGVKVSNWQIASLIKVSILKATNRVSECSIAGDHVGPATKEEEDAGIGTINRTAPIEAEGTDIAERTIAAFAEARHGQLKRRCKSSRCVVGSPRPSLLIPLRIGR